MTVTGYFDFLFVVTELIAVCLDEPWNLTRCLQIFMGFFLCAAVVRKNLSFFISLVCRYLIIQLW